jgi:hypothetical protein
MKQILYSIGFTWLIIGGFSVQGQSRDKAQGFTGITKTGSATLNTPFKDSNFRIYPNPAKDHLMIEHEIQGKFTLQLSNILGQIVAQKEVINPGNIEKFDFGKLNSGHYILQITQGNQSRSLKVIIQ